ncbi:hypothetical protein SAMN05421747_102336 [Parapedobacter composti]|uniref:Uncharacterized protein n=1 Tax=Parapedobacter composti TaxID=623281 RepID=A0A1I1FAB1_9SPHI|nr:hypothetical protein SAMN05421747_102336 [Parapedobacter composti]
MYKDEYQSKNAIVNKALYSKRGCLFGQPLLLDNYCFPLLITDSVLRSFDVRYTNPIIMSIFSIIYNYLTARGETSACTCFVSVVEY